jgi:hypothetical protein
MGGIMGYVTNASYTTPTYTQAVEDMYTEKMKERRGKKSKVEQRHLNEEMMKLIPIGVCIRCQTLMYLGMTNCSKCGAPVGESIDLEELQDKVQELLKPESEIVYKEVPQHQFWGYGTTATTNSPITMACYTSDENMVGITYNFESS